MYLNHILTIEEKIDGANLGIQMDANYKISYQNRSHYVTYETSSQFKGLRTWEEQHLGDLFSILMSDKPNRYILYGEWCYLKHSIQYDELPDYFMAFDIFDKYANKFVSRDHFHAMVSNTNISTVPMISHIEFDNYQDLKSNLLELLETKSKYTDNPVEGVYIRMDEDKFLTRRCKLVRPDFTQSIDTHWSKAEPVKNRVKDW
jgi:ATP-dependent RNA circularization protein (DNA/RNA ligase family)